MLQLLRYALPVFIGFFVLTACQTTQQANDDTPNLHAKIERGMSHTQVRAVLGPPIQTLEQKGELKWMVYGTPTEQTMIYFADGKVAIVP